MDKLQEDRQLTVVTKRGVPVVELAPIENASLNMIACAVGVVEVLGDLESSAVRADQWQVD